MHACERRSSHLLRRPEFSAFRRAAQRNSETEESTLNSPTSCFTRSCSCEPATANAISAGRRAVNSTLRLRRPSYTGTTSHSRVHENRCAQAPPPFPSPTSFVQRPPEADVPRRSAHIVRPKQADEESSEMDRQGPHRRGPPYSNCLQAASDQSPKGGAKRSLAEPTHQPCRTSTLAHPLARRSLTIGPTRRSE